MLALRDGEYFSLNLFISSVVSDAIASILLL
jgi:hypothetical protein